ncbi:glycosyltransferase involved in cell wall biosynthesis [Sulfuritortus calidifontis]|uniref:Glycosyltransferase involved in cell wall biosynthesis n=2 Tax=Sulfuritortus calidifontis TaxID=1914471 RepID=A0A4R3JVB3_9PROT|nr:glycosyltransferase involved in cell wall biosynthesis [Sulfuritortus calidifontis]
MECWGNGGTETYVAGLVRLLAAQNFEVTLALLNNGDEDAVDFLPRNRIRVIGLAGLPKALRQQRPDVVSLHLYAHLLPAMLVCRALRYPTVTTLHMPLESWGLRHRLYWRLAIRLSSTVIGVSKQVLNPLKGRNIWPSAIPGGVDPLFFTCPRDKQRPTAEAFTLIAMGRLAAEKDWATLIEAVARLPLPLRQRTAIEFYGSGILQNELDSLAKRCGVQTAFHGHAGKDQLVQALSTADLFVLPSRFEGLGLAALEAMAAGVPTITADFAAARGYIEQGVTGHRFPVGDATGLARWIEWHMTHPEASIAIGLKGREFVRQHFSEEKAYRPYLEIFKQVAN